MLILIMIFVLVAIALMVFSLFFVQRRAKRIESGMKTLNKKVNKLDAKSRGEEWDGMEEEGYFKIGDMLVHDGVYRKKTAYESTIEMEGTDE